MSRNKKNIVICFLLFVICCFFVFCYTFFFSSCITDEIWNYGFGYNIATGLVPYRDFNMIITPLYPFVVSIFIKIFGHHLWSLHMLNAIMVSIILFIMHKRLSKKIMLIFPILLFCSYPNYNFFCLFLVIILFYIIDSNYKNNDILCSLIVSSLFLTKQTVGAFLFIPMFYYSKNKLKAFITFLIPIFLFCIYLLYNHAMYNFIDYCFLGMFDFTESNKLYLFLPFEFVILVILLYKNLKYRFLNKRLFYILMFQIIVFPIVDFYHFGISLILVCYYLLSKIKIDSKKIKYYSFILFFAVFMWGYCLRDIYYGNHFYDDSSSYLYGRYVDSYIQDSITIISKYVENIKSEYDNVYFLNSHAYEIKMNTSYEINKFDLINNGNMGYNGSVRYIEEIDNYCKNNSCVFILYKYEIPNEEKYIQINVDILNYVSDNYKYIESVDVFDIYSN